MRPQNFLAAIILFAASAMAQNPAYELLERIAPGNSARFLLEKTPSDERFFEIGAAPDGRVKISGNDYVSVSTGLGWYMKYYTGNHLCWNNMEARLPEVLQLPAAPERHTNPLPYTYYLNYCTHSYSMAFWDAERWQREIDWMALHGVNMPLMLTGAEQVWNNVMERLGYSRNEIDAFIAGPAFQAWWLMNNLEGWGGPVGNAWRTDRAQLAATNIRQMRALDIEPVLPGYAGMVPHDAATRLGLDVADPGKWCDYTRPAFLQPTDPNFERVADIYYDELAKLYGKARFYAIDPFHEGGNTQGVDLARSGKAIVDAMKRGASDSAVWVVQAWQGNPRRDMIAPVERGDMIVLDLWAESCPQWGDETSAWRRPDGFDGHQWIQCMLLNYGGNVGLHGKLPHLPQAYAKARESRFADSMVGVGLTMEGIENNPVMYELMTELPWHDSVPQASQWLSQYLNARYGTTPDAPLPPEVARAWQLLARSIYNCPPQSRQQGTTESIFCARPALKVKDASSWANSSAYYDPADVIRAAALIDSAFRRGFGAGNNNFEYDRVDILRQANAERARMLNDSVATAFAAADRRNLDKYAGEFLSLLESQDSLLATRPEFRLDTWTDMAHRCAPDSASARLNRLNALLLITTWGNRSAADRGGLHDYGNREWSGLLGGLYQRRWRLWFDRLREALDRDLREAPVVDWFEVESGWIEEMTGTSDPAELSAAAR